MKDIMSAFPNFHCITLKNMVYFNCDWLRQIPRSVTIAIDMYLETMTAGDSKFTKGSTTGRLLLPQFFILKYFKLFLMLPNQIRLKIKKKSFFYNSQK